MDKAAADEINEWAKYNQLLLKHFVYLFCRLTDKFSSELKRYQLICFYCGVAMDDKVINKKCTVNARIPEGC